MADDARGRASDRAPEDYQGVYDNSTKKIWREDRSRCWSLIGFLVLYVVILLLVLLTFYYATEDMKTTALFLTGIAITYGGVFITVYRVNHFLANSYLLLSSIALLAWSGFLQLQQEGIAIFALFLSILFSFFLFFSICHSQFLILLWILFKILLILWTIDFWKRRIAREDFCEYSFPLP